MSYIYQSVTVNATQRILRIRVLWKYKWLKMYQMMKTNITHVKPLRTLLGKSESSRMTEISGAYYKSQFDGNTILLKISQENG